MSWQPPTQEQRVARAMELREQSSVLVVHTIKNLYAMTTVTIVIGALIAIVGTPFMAMTLGRGQKALALLPIAVGLFVGGIGVIQRRIYRPLPKELLTSGVATPAVVMEAGMVGPSVQPRGPGGGLTLMRHRYRIVVQPPGGAPYEVDVRTFDGPMMAAINQPPLTVFVDPKNPMRICPDWTTVPKGA